MSYETRNFLKRMVNFICVLIMLLIVGVITYALPPIGIALALTIAFVVVSLGVR